jgi:hypothetical protein
MRLVPAQRVAVVEEDIVVVEEDKEVAKGATVAEREAMAVVKETTAVAAEDEGATDDAQPAVIANRHGCLTSPHADKNCVGFLKFGCALSTGGYPVEW